MEPISRHTKLKIITGYIILFIFSLFAVIFIYKQIIRLTANEEKINHTSQKLFIIGNTLTGLYEAESLSNAFLQTGSASTFNRFIDRMEKVGNNIDSLQNLTTRKEQKTKLDSIDLLLEQKMSNLNALIHAKQSLKPDDFYKQAIDRIETTRDSLESQQETRERVVTTVDSAYVKTEKKRRNFWGWLTKPKTDSTLKIIISQHTVTDTLAQTNQLQNPDTVVNLLKTVWNDLQEKNKNIKQEISRTEYNIIRQSTRITDQLRRILGDYEKEELTNSFQKIEKREKIIHTSTRIIAGIAVAAFLLILLFSFFILRDLSRSQRYRRELENANRYADQLLKSREKLILTVTHDIKSPLGSIIGYTELLEATPIDERQKYFLKNMQASSQHILRLVTDLLDYSKLENNKMPLEEVIFNPVQLFRETCDSFLPMAKAKNLNLICKISEDLNIDCSGDALRIRQVLANLLSNAVKYTAQGEIRFKATTSTQEDKIIIRVEDTGPGLTAEEQKTIFDEFTRLSGSSHIEGTGLGLTITLKLIELLGGKISLQSEPGKGSCFMLQLPLKRKAKNSSSTENSGPIENNNSGSREKTDPVGKPNLAKNESSTEISALSQGNETTLFSEPSEKAQLRPTQEKLSQTHTHSKLCILLVDDDPLQLEMTSSLLGSKGIQADTTTESGKVIEILRQTSYDFVFSDIQMPGTDGFTLIRKIRASSLPNAKDLRVVALSANSENNEESYRKAGFTAYLNKPFTSDQLFGLIEKLSGISFQSSSRHSLLSPSQNESGIPEEYTLKNILLFADNDQQAVQQILRVFIQDTRQNLELLKNYIQNKDNEAIQKLAHKMLPMFRQLEARHLTELLQKLESMHRTPLSGEEIARIVTEITAKTNSLLNKLLH